MSEAEQAGDTRHGTEGRLLAGRYRLGKTLGRGGMGTVWRADDQMLGRTVAIKELRFPSSDEDEKRRLITRTLREAKAIARIHDKSAVTVYDVVEEDDRPWIVMELVEGRSLAEIIREDGVLTWQRAAEVGLALLDVLRAAHREGILHRDVKPSNVLIADEDDRIVLTDFGIAYMEGDPSITSTGMLVGAASYIAPERARGHRPGPAADLWSLGALLYACVEGGPPYDKGSAIATLTAVMTEPLERPRNAGPLESVICGLLIKNAARRLDDAGARAMLHEILEADRAGTAQGGDDTATTALVTPSAHRPGPQADPNGRPGDSQDPAAPRAIPAQGEGPAAAGAAAAPGPSDTGSQGVPRTASSGTGARPDDSARPGVSGTPQDAPVAPANDPTPTNQPVPPRPPAATRHPLETPAEASPGTPLDPRDSTGTGGHRAPSAYHQDHSGGAPVDQRTTFLGGNGQPLPRNAAGTGAPATGGRRPGPPVSFDKDEWPPRRPAAPVGPPSAGPAASGTGPAGDAGAPYADGTGTPSVPSFRAVFGPEGPPPGTVIPTPEATGESSASSTRSRTHARPSSGLPVSRQTLVIVAVAVAVAVLGTVLALTLSGGDDTASHGTGGTTTSGGATGTDGGKGGGGKKPDSDPGHKGSGGSEGEGDGGKSGGEGKTGGSGGGSDEHRHTDPNGFSIGLPGGWKVDYTDGAGVHFIGPDGQQLLVGTTSSPKNSPLLDWFKQEEDIKLSEYDRVRIETVGYRGWPAADWEYTYVQKGTKYRRINRGFVVDINRGYALRYTAKDSSWDSAQRRDTWKTFVRTFQPKSKS